MLAFQFNKNFKINIFENDLSDKGSWILGRCMLTHAKIGCDAMIKQWMVFLNLLGIPADRENLLTKIPPNTSQNTYEYGH